MQKNGRLGKNTQLSIRPLETVWSGRSLPPKLAKKGLAVYVPAYSNISSQSGTTTLLETTLSVRNTDPEHPMQIDHVHYFNSEGTLVKELTDETVTLRPMQTVSYLVKEQDDSGGLGANFVVEWSAQDAINRPIIEAVMIGKDGLSFVSRGEPIERR